MSMDAIDFSQELPLFPLPNCVLFPGVVQPLHIFEPRYREMVADALEADHLITMALLKDGWEKDYYGRPAVHPVVCVGKIVAHEKSDDDKYNLLLQGLTRARVVTEAKHGLYRVAKLKPLHDTAAEEADDNTQREALRLLFAETALNRLPVAKTVQELVGEKVSAAHLADMLAFALIQDVKTKQRLLEQLDGTQRVAMVMNALTILAQAMSSAGAPKRFAPRISNN